MRLRVDYVVADGANEGKLAAKGTTISSRAVYNSLMLATKANLPTYL